MGCQKCPRSQTSLMHNFVLLISITTLLTSCDALECVLPEGRPYVEMCRNGCNNYTIPDEAIHTSITIRDSRSSSGCDLAIHTKPGLGLWVEAGVLFNVQDCGETCGNSNFVSFTDRQSSRCRCGERVINTALYNTTRSSVVIDYSGAVFSLLVRPIGCQIEQLSNSKKAQAVMVRGSFAPGESYVVNVTCQEGYLIAQKYLFIENRCTIPLATVNSYVGTWEKSSVGCKKIKCSQPADIPNGSYSPWKPENDPYRYRDVVTYECDEGYERTAGSAQRTCIGVHGTGAVFNGEELVCSKVDCGPVPSIEDGVSEGSATDYESIHTVTCDLGFSVTGPSTTECQANGNWTSIPTCSIVECNEFPVVDNASHVVRASDHTSGIGNSRAYGSRWVFTCLSGLQMIGGSIMTCQADGTWTAAPICTVEACDLNDLPASADHTCLDCERVGDNAVNATRTYQCIAGYTDRTMNSTCQRTGAWSALDSCTRVDCGQPDPVSNGWWRLGTSQYEDTAELVCDAGYTRDSDKVTTCSIDGNWLNAPACDPVDCGPPPQVPYLVSEVGFHVTIFRSRIGYYCAPGYLPSDNVEEIECTESGQWTPLPTCQIRNCGMPSVIEVANATRTTLSETIYGAEINYQCNYGLMFKSAKSLKCQSNGKWSKLPECILVDCGIPANITSATMISYNGTSLGSSVTYKCEGPVTNSVEGSCGEDGQWSYPDCAKPPTDKEAMPYIYIGCGVGMLIVVLVVILLVGLCFRIKARRRSEKVKNLAEKCKGRDHISHCSHDSGLSVGGEHGESDNPPSVSSYDYKNGGLLMKSARPQGSPPGPYSTNSLTKPRSRQPIAEGVCLEMMGMPEEIPNALYGEQKADKRGSKTSSPCNLRQSPVPVGGGASSPYLNNLNLKEMEENNPPHSTYSGGTHDRHGNITDYNGAAGTSSLGRYHTNPKNLRVLPGQEPRYKLEQDDTANPDYYTRTLPVRTPHFEQPVSF